MTVRAPWREGYERSAGTPSAKIHRHSDGITVLAGKHQLDLLAPSVTRSRYEIEAVDDGPPAVAMAYRVADLDACERALESGEIEFQKRNGVVVVSSRCASNVALEFTSELS